MLRRRKKKDHVCALIGPALGYASFGTVPKNHHPTSMDSPWDENPDSTGHQDAEWNRMSSDFTNVRRSLHWLASRNHHTTFRSDTAKE